MSKYTKQSFVEGQMLKAQHLNHIENGISSLASNLSTRQQDLENLSKTISNLHGGTGIQCDAEGAIVTVTDASARDAHRLNSTITAAQAGTGDPSPDNIRAISGWDAATATRTGRNLVSHLDLKTTAYGFAGYTATEDAVDLTEPSQYDYASIPVHLKGGTTYTLHYTYEVYGRAEDATGKTKLRLRFGASSPAVTDESVTANGTYTKLIVCTPDSNIDDRILLNLNYGSSVPACVRVQVMLLEGEYTEDTIPAFEPCDKQAITAALTETVYGGTLDWTTGLLTITHVMRTYDGTEDWTYGSTNSICSLVSLPDGALINNQAAYHKCSHYRPIRYRAGDVQTDKTCYTLNTTTLMVKDTSLTSLEDWTGYLAAQAAAGTPMTIVWALKEASYKTIQLTAQQLTLLKGENHVWSDTGDTNLTYVADTKIYIDNQLATVTAAIVNV